VSAYDLTRNQLVWAGTAQTISPRSLDREIAGYVETVIKALKRDRVLVARTMRPADAALAGVDPLRRARPDRAA
jgi:hypothetical protein